MKIFCAGLECSGNHWVWSVLGQHPDLEVTGASFPTEYGEKRCYEMPAPDVDAIIIITRDVNCQRASAASHNYNEATTDRFSDADNAMHLLSLHALGKSVVFVSYETALVWGQWYWSSIFIQLGVEPVAIKTDYIDGNTKYVTGNRE